MANERYVFQQSALVALKTATNTHSIDATKGESMIPEGLEWASVESILDMVASVGWNVIRM